MYIYIYIDRQIDRQIDIDRQIQLQTYVYKILETITENDRDKEYFGLHTTSFASIALQVCTTGATMYIKFVKTDAV